MRQPAFETVVIVRFILAHWNSLGNNKRLRVERGGAKDTKTTKSHEMEPTEKVNSKSQITNSKQIPSTKSQTVERRGRRVEREELRGNNKSQMTNPKQISTSKFQQVVPSADSQAFAWHPRGWPRDGTAAAVKVRRLCFLGRACVCEARFNLRALRPSGWQHRVGEVLFCIPCR